jgi:hypothetical protein
VIIDVTLNSDQSNAKAKELGASIKAIKEEQKQLKESGKETDVAYQSNAANLRLLQAEQKAYIQMANAAEGANHELSAQLTLLTQQYNAMGREERNNTVAGKALQVQIKSVSDELKGNKEAIGDHRMSVGDYEKANRSATAATAAQTEGMKSLKDVISSVVPGFQGLTDQLSKTQDSFKSVVSSLKESNAAMKASKEATLASEAAKKEATAVNSRYAAGEATLTEVQVANTAATNASIIATEAQTVATAAATNATKVLKAAMAATGIGAVIILVASLVSWLTKFKPLTDAIEQGVSGVSAAFEVLGNHVYNITKPLINVFTSPRKALVDFSNFLQQNIINRFKAFGVIIEAIRTRNLKMLGDGFIQVSTGVTDATDKISKGVMNFSKNMSQAAVDASKLQQKTQDLEDAQRQSTATLSKLRLERDRFAIQAKNTALTEEQRIALLEKANQKEKEAYTLESNLAKQSLALINEEIALDAKRNQGREMSDALQEKLYAGQAKVNDLEAQSLKFTEKRYNDQAKLREKAAAQGEKAAEKANEAEQSRLESLLRTNESMLTERQREVAAVNREIDEKIAKYKQYGATTEQLEKERTARLRQIAEDFRKQDLEAIEANNKTIQDIAVNSIKDESIRRLAQLQLNQDRELEEVTRNRQLVQDRISKGETGLNELLKSFDDRKTSILQEGSTAREELIKQNYQVELDAFNKQQVDLANASLSSATTDADKLFAKQVLLDAQYQMEMDHANLVGQDTTLIVAEYEAEKRALVSETNNSAFEGFKSFSSSFQSLTKENSNAYKIAGAIQAKIDAAQVLRNNILIIQANIKAIAEQGKLVFPFNIVAIASTLAALAGAIASAKTLVAPVALATGGVFESDGLGSIVKGPGTGTSDSINARLSNGEAVINAKSTRMFKPLLSMINKAGGGAELDPGQSMALGGIAQGGFISRMTTEAMSGAQVANVIIKAIQAMPAPQLDSESLVNAVKALPPPIIDVQEFTTTQQRMHQAKVSANL